MNYPILYQAFKNHINLPIEAYLDLEKRLLRKTLGKNEYLIREGQVIRHLPDEYETRAPIRSMLVKNIDGEDQLVAAYTCSPLVLIPLNELKDGAKVKARTLGDMGNGQPIDMVSFNMQGNEMLFVTNNS